MQASESQILQLERKALDRWGQGDSAGFNDLYADDVSYFDPLTRARIDGRKALGVYCESSQSPKTEMSRYEIENPQVINADGLSVLTYNLTTYHRDAEDNEKLGDAWNCTAVYRQKDGQWKIVHSHWSYTAHEAFREPPVEGEAGA